MKYIMVSKRCKVAGGLILGCGSVAALTVGLISGPVGLIVGGFLGIAAVGFYFLAISLRR